MNRTFITAVQSIRQAVLEVSPGTREYRELCDKAVRDHRKAQPAKQLTGIFNQFVSRLQWANNINDVQRILSQSAR